MAVIDTINIGGKRRPFHFSNLCAYRYEQMTGRNYTADVFSCFQNLLNAAQIANEGTHDAKLAATATFKVSLITDLAFVGFEYAYSKMGSTMDFGKDEIAAWILEDEVAAGAIMKAIYMAVAPKDKEPANEPHSKKKTSSRRAA